MIKKISRFVAQVKFEQVYSSGKKRFPIHHCLFKLGGPSIRGVSMISLVGWQRGDKRCLCWGGGVINLTVYNCNKH